MIRFRAPVAVKFVGTDGLTGGVGGGVGVDVAAGGSVEAAVVELLSLPHPITIAVIVKRKPISTARMFAPIA